MDIRIPYGFTPREYQIPLWSYIVRGGKRAFWCVHRRGGKDLTCWNIVIAMALKRVGNYKYLFPDQTHAKKVIWYGKTKDGRSFLDFIPKPLLDGPPNSTELLIKLKNGSHIQLDGTMDVDRLLGQGPVGIVFSEYQKHESDVWPYVSPMLKESDGWAIFNGTARPPAEAPHFKRTLDAAISNPAWFAEVLTIDDTKAYSVEDVEQEIKDGLIKRSEARQEYWNDFYASTDNILIPVDILKSSVDRKISFRYAPIVAGLDVGMSLGGDPSALVVRQGGQILGIYEAKMNDTESIIGWASERLKKHFCNTVVVDSIGWGKGVADGLPGRGLNVIKLNVSEGAAYKDMFARRRDELWWATRDFFDEKQCCIPSELELHRRLINELSGVEYGYTPGTMKIKVEGKVDMKKRLGCSPNLADALVMSMADEGAAAIAYESITKPRYLVA